MSQLEDGGQKLKGENRQGLGLGMGDLQNVGREGHYRGPE
jgi:hypothetical protein